MGEYPGAGTTHFNCGARESVVIRLMPAPAHVCGYQMLQRSMGTVYTIRSIFVLPPLPPSFHFGSLSSDVDPVRAHAYFPFDLLAEERH